jgi:5'-deoxynucleotidase
LSENFFAYISRMRYITRWSLMRNSYAENIQEHSHMVAVLAHALAVLRNRYFGGNLDVGAVAVAALYHDASEILTGDLPTPIKYANPAIRDSYKAIESVAQDKLLSMLPEELLPDFEPVLKEKDPEIAVIVKAADKLSAYIKCVEEQKAGNNEFDAAAKQIYATLEENPLPEVQYFMEHFLPGFSLTLDELNQQEER